MDKGYAKDGLVAMVCRQTTKQQQRATRIMNKQRFTSKVRPMSEVVPTTSDFATLFEQLLDEGKLELACPTSNVQAVRRAMTYAKQAYNRRMKDDGDKRRIFTDLFAHPILDGVPYMRILFSLIGTREEPSVFNRPIERSPSALSVITGEALELHKQRSGYNNAEEE